MGDTPLAPVCILAGGLATRLGDHARTTPKALVEVAGSPFIYHQLRLLRSHGAERVVLCIGHLGERIREVVGDGSAFELQVDYSDEGAAPIGTAGAIRLALPLLGDAFLVLYGDTYLRIDYRAVERAYRDSRCPALMTVLRNDGRWDTSNALLEASDLADVYAELSSRGCLAAFEATERFYEVGTPDALAETSRFLSALGVPDPSTGP
jgi:MurNAc alpha-1-phosphate uridylyltransferase